MECDVSRLVPMYEMLSRLRLRFVGLPMTETPHRDRYEHQYNDLSSLQISLDFPHNKLETSLKGDPSGTSSN